MLLKLKFQLSYLTVLVETETAHASLYLSWLGFLNIYSTKMFVEEKKLEIRPYVRNFNELKKIKNLMSRPTNGFFPFQITIFKASVVCKN